MNNDKLHNIEETLAHQEQQINDLSEMLIVQNNEIEKLKKKISKVEGKIENAREGAPAADQKPPHY